MSMRQTVGWLILFAAGASLAWRNIAHYKVYSERMGALTNQYDVITFVSITIGLAMVIISVVAFARNLRRPRQSILTRRDV